MQGVGGFDGQHELLLEKSQRRFSGREVGTGSLTVPDQDVAGNSAAGAEIDVVQKRQRTDEPQEGEILAAAANGAPAVGPNGSLDFIVPVEPNEARVAPVAEELRVLRAWENHCNGNEIHGEVLDHGIHIWNCRPHPPSCNKVVSPATGSYGLIKRSMRMFQNKRLGAGKIGVVGGQGRQGDLIFSN
jgi:hypothetical protein